MRTSTVLSFLLLLACNTTITAVEARKLRGNRSITTRKLNDEKLLFTEGRKAGDGKDNGKGKEAGSGKSSDYWTSEDGGTSGMASYQESSYDEGNEKSSKGESIYDRPAMKIRDSADKGDSQSSSDTKDKRSKEEKSYEGKSTAAKGSAKSRASKASGKSTTTKGGKSTTTAGRSEDEPAAKEKDNGSNKKTRNGPDTPVNPSAAPAGAPGSSMEFVTSQFGLRFQISPNGGIPQTASFAELEAATIAYLEEYLELTYNGDSMIFFDSVAIAATSRSISGAGGPFVDFEASVAFLEDSPMIPTNQEVALTIADALSESNLSTYLFALAQSLSNGNPFLTTTAVTTYVPDSAGGSGRVATNKKISGTGIFAAMSAAAVTLAIGGFLVFKVRNENKDGINKFGKGYSGGETLAGDTYDNTTLEATRRPTDDIHSLNTTTYNDEHSYLANFPTGTVHAPGILKSPLPSKMDDASEMTEEVSPTLTDDLDDDASIPSSQLGAYASIIGRTKALVPSLKNASPMTNKQIKNYFKSKYKCSSPKDYAAVGETNEAEAPAGDAESHGDDDTVLGPCLDLGLPALDHESIMSEQPTDEGRQEIFEDEMSLDSKIDSSVSSEVGSSLLPPSKVNSTAPRSPGEEIEGEGAPTSQGSMSIDNKSLDDVSLM